MDTAKLVLDGHEYEFPVIVGSEGEVGVDFTKLRATTGAIAFDPGYGNTGACESGITFINGEEGLLAYCGYTIEELAEKSTFVEVCYLLIYGHLPTTDELEDFRHALTYHTLIHEDMKKFFEGYPPSAHPMAIMSAMLISLSAYYPDSEESETMDLNIVRLLAKAKTIAAFSYKKSIGQPYIYPRNDLTYVGDFLNMLFAAPRKIIIYPLVWNVRLICS